MHLVNEWRFIFFIGTRLLSTHGTESFKDAVDEATVDCLISHVCIIRHLEGFSKDFEVELNGFFLFLLPLLGKHGIFAVVVWLAG